MLADKRKAKKAEGRQMKERKAINPLEKEPLRQEGWTPPIQGMHGTDRTREASHCCCESFSKLLVDIGRRNEGKGLSHKDCSILPYSLISRCGSVGMKAKCGPSTYTIVKIRI